MIRKSELDVNSNRMRKIWARLRGTVALRIETAANTEFEWSKGEKYSLQTMNAGRST